MAELIPVPPPERRYVFQGDGQYSPGFSPPVLSLALLPSFHIIHTPHTTENIPNQPHFVAFIFLSMPQKSPTARTWGSRFDPLPSESPPSTSPVEHDTKMGSGGGDVSDAALMKREEKMPHDSSVFVGRLVFCSCDAIELIVDQSFTMIKPPSGDRAARPRSHAY